jgi:hypothetical protein
MSILQVTKIVTVNNTTPLILATGNAGGGQIIIQSSNTDVSFSGNINFTNFVTGDGSGLFLPTSGVANAAFNTANAVFAIANTIDTQIKPAFDRANSSYASVNSNWTVTNAVYSVANSAFASANNVAPQVAPAYLTANLAYALANAAYNAQNTDYTSSNAAYTTANVAFNTANAAFASANNVAPQVTPAFLTANLAYSTANAAFAAGNAEYTFSNVIYAAVNSAFATINAVYGSSNSDYVVSNSAFATVNAAYASINSNWTVGNTAYAVANAAFSKANAALANTSGVYTAGDLNIPGILYLRGTSGSTGIIDFTASAVPIVYKNTATKFEFTSAGDRTANNPFWLGYHFATKDVITQSGVNTYPRTSLYYTYTTPTDPTDLQFVIEGGNAGSLAHGLSLRASGGGGLSNITMWTTATERVRITSGGNVGIGTSSPVAKLEVAGTINTNNSITLTAVPNYRNVPFINASYTISSSFNEMSIGPINISDGVTVTINDGANWVIV